MGAWDWVKDHWDPGHIFGQSKEDKAKQGSLNTVGGNVGVLADDAHVNYQNLSGRLNGSLDELQARANGQNSVSALQLHQALQQNLANQRAMAAGASPNNAAMAARTASNNMGRMGVGLAGQQAVAGLQERNQAQDAYAQMLGQARGQDANTAVGAYNAQTGAYSGGLNGQANPNPAGNVAVGVLQAYGLGGMSQK